MRVSYAQQGIYIPPGGAVWMSGNAGMFNDVTNDGMLGSNAGTTLYFMGKRWTNGSGATLPDESTGITGIGGRFLFSSTNPLYGNIGQQTVFGAYNLISRQGAGFPNLDIDNPAGLLLSDLSDLWIRNNLHFTKGRIYLNGWNMLVGTDQPGTITGYSDQRFVVTGTTFAGGALYRARLTNSAGRVVFPVGTTDDNYAPAAVLLTNTSDDISVRVFDSVYAYAGGGPAYKDSVVNKTWQINATKDIGGEATVILQHQDADELPAYAASRDSGFITRFTGGVWDKIPYLPATGIPGTLTTAGLQVPSTMHIRNFSDVGKQNFLSKSFLESKAKPADFIRFEAYRIAISVVQLDWTTSRETNNDHFEIERRLENETDFSLISIMPTKAPGGNSRTPLTYGYQDMNGYDGWSYYRIKAVSRSGKVSYTEIRAVPPFVQIDVFPNPNQGEFKVRIRGIREPLLMQLYDTWGQVVRRQSVQTEGDVAITGMPAGTYVLVLYHKTTMKVAYTCKVVVVH